jgi:hypothetical protein
MCTQAPDLGCGRTDKKVLLQHKPKNRPWPNYDSDSCVGKGNNILFGQLANSSKSVKSALAHAQNQSE